MSRYLLRRLLLIPVTLFAILLVNFVVIQFAPGGPVEQVLAEVRGVGGGALDALGGGGAAADRAAAASQDSAYRGAQGLPPAFVAQLEAQFGFDRPAHERFFTMVADYLSFDLGQSYFKGRPVTDLIMDALPVSVSLGLWSTLLIYLVSIPLGIAKAVRDGSRFDVASSAVIIVGYAVPGFLLAIALIVLFAGGQYWQIFPLRGLTSSNWESMGPVQQVLDYLWHLVLPVTCIAAGGLATLTMLTKNAFLDEITKQYVVTARAKGLSERRVLLGHVFRNAMLIVIAGFPGVLLSMLFTGALLIEVIFSLEGLGLLGFEAAIGRDYPVVFGTLYVFALLGLVVNLLTDLTYHLVDPRIDFEARRA